MRFNLPALIAFACAAALTAGCSEPLNEVLGRAVSPDGKLIAVALLCPHNEAIGGQILIGAVFRAETPRTDCVALRETGPLASFNTYGGKRRPLPAPIIEWTAPDRAVITVADVVVAAKTHMPGMDKLLEARVAPAAANP